jgi:hypothetical protein
MTQYEEDTNLHFQPVTQRVEFSRLFEAQDANNLMFTSALRMSATFPYITPLTELPCKPAISVMDAGMLDNFGEEEAVKFIWSFQKWLEANTSKIIIVQIRDQYKEAEITDNSPHDFYESLTFPINQYYDNLFPIQNNKQDQLLEYMSKWYKGKVYVIGFQLNNEGSKDISLSWHLTRSEEEKVPSSMQSPDNKKNMALLMELLGARSKE